MVLTVILQTVHITMPEGMVMQDTAAVTASADMPMSQVDMGMLHQHPPLAVSQDAPVPTVTHLVFPDPMGGYNVQILTRNFQFTPANINRDPQDNEGHAHIYINDVKYARVYSDWFNLPASALLPGENQVKVTLNANNHSEWSVDDIPISSTVSVVVPE
ncbi:hypothetical protein KBW81_17825 (plasmid) [Loktanella salsilacus]|uniref:hypothetical protein n=1 Tax=Loktanella salsilacus TaxID=195913 RepID=UPI0020B84E3E|nr:hypothetical protein [Loktanella salsilacus]UTH50054.1 hypothetical protein KBW81_17825 [Loktanella salsilacus]